MKCTNCTESCGMNNVKESICCFYCKHRESCEGVCIEFEDNGLYEDVARECSDFVEY